MYPNKPPEQLGFYVPPSLEGGQNMASQYGGGGQGGNNKLNDLFQNLLQSKPSFDPNVFGGPVHKSKFWFTNNPNHNFITHLYNIKFKAIILNQAN